MNSVLIAFLALLASSLRTRASLQAEVLAFATKCGSSGQRAAPFAP